MDLKKKASRSIAIALVGVSMVTPILNIAYANEVNIEQNTKQVDNIKDYSIQPRLGGGPSPSAAWAYSRTVVVTKTNKQLRDMLPKAERALRAGERTRFAFEFSQMLGASTGTVYGLAWSEFCNFLDFGIEPMRQNVNTIKAAIRKNKTVKLRAALYVRPATGAKMIYLTGVY